MSNLFYRGTGEPFHCIEERRARLRPLPNPLKVARFGVGLILLAAAICYFLTWGR
jgi:hypothetical protein